MAAEHEKKAREIVEAWDDGDQAWISNDWVKGWKPSLIEVIAAALDEAVKAKSANAICFEYLSHRGVVEIRHAVPLRIEYRTSVHVTDAPEWMLVSHCLDRKAERAFALSKISRFLPLGAIRSRGE